MATTGQTHHEEHSGRFLELNTLAPEATGLAQQRCARRVTYRVLNVGAIEANTLSCQAVEVRGLRVAYCGRSAEFETELPDTELHAALDVAEQLRRAVRAAPVQIDGEEPVQCTVSLGVASRAEDDPDPSALLRRADEALYRAKRSGRDRSLPQD